MSKSRKLILELHDFENDKGLQAIEELKASGWLFDGILEGIDLHFTHLQKANLSNANLQRVNFNMADLRFVDLNAADLREAHLNHTDLYRADLLDTNLAGASLIKANLQSVKHLRDDQLAQAYSLSDATMPGGSIYDGRFNLPGDIHQPQSGITTDVLDLREDSEQSELHRDFPASLLNISDAHLILKLHSFDNRIVAKAVKALRKRGLLTDGTLQWLELRFAHFGGLDLFAADLSWADFCMADLHDANLSCAHLVHTDLHQANLREVNLYKTDLRGAILTNAILQGAQNWTYEQLIQLSKLRNAMMPDGSRYDGRFNLAGDLMHVPSLGISLKNHDYLADYYGVSLEDYLAGQAWADKHLSSIRSHVGSLGSIKKKSGYQLENHSFEQI